MHTFVQNLGSGADVVVIDDEDSIREGCRQALESEGYRALLADNGTAGLELVKQARKIYDQLRPQFVTAWDDIGNIGKRYRRQDEIGTPWCVTVDYQTLEDDTVTVRDRDSMKQERMDVKELVSYIKRKLGD